MIKSATAALVSWTAIDNKPLSVEQWEALHLKSLKLTEKTAKEGMAVGMHYRMQLWSRTLMSIHGKLAEVIFC